MPSRRRSSLLTYLVVGPFALVLAFPFYWMLQTSLKTDLDLYNTQNNPFGFAQGSPTTSQLPVPLHRYAVRALAPEHRARRPGRRRVTLAVSLPAGYALARLSGGWGQSLGVGIFLVYLVPPTLLFLPLSRVIAELGLQDRLASLIIVYPGFTIPFSTWL